VADAVDAVDAVILAEELDVAALWARPSAERRSQSLLLARSPFPPGRGLN